MLNYCIARIQIRRYFHLSIFLIRSEELSFVRHDKGSALTFRNFTRFGDGITDQRSGKSSTAFDILKSGFLIRAIGGCVIRIDITRFELSFIGHRIGDHDKFG